MSVIEYAQARIQSRFGARPQPELWRGLDAAPDMDAYLDVVRGTSLQRWVSGIEPGADLHGIDSSLRARLEAHIAEVARWLPQEWRPAALWLPLLFDLPAIQQPGSGEAPDFLRRYRKNTRRAAVRESEVRAAFLEEWMRRWPARDRESLRGMQRIAVTIVGHLERFARASVRDAWQERARLERDLRRLFRNSALRPEAAFCHLALVALDLERLRAGLVRRVLWRGERKSA
jgi:hypothetical protein